MNKKQFALWTLSGTVATLAALLPATGSASNFQLTEQSVTSLGRAHSGGAAAAEDASSIWYNPAGLSNLSGAEIMGGYSLIRFGADFSKTSATDAIGQPLSGGEGGSVGKKGGPVFVYYSRPINDQWTFGFGVNTPFGLATKYDNDSIFRYQAIYSSVSVVNYNPTLAWKVNDQFSLGFGIDYQDMTVKLTNDVDFGAVCFGSLNPTTCTALGLTPQSHDGFFSAQASGTGTGFNLGALWNVSSDTRFGVAYRSRVKHTLDGHDSFANVPTAFQTQPTFQGQGVSADFTSPQLLSLSYFHQVDEKWSIYADYSYAGWNSFDSLDIHFKTSGDDVIVDEGLSNASRYSFGADYRYSDDWTFRSGLALDKSPVPDPTAASDTTPNNLNASRTARLPDGDRKWIAFGATWRTSEHSQWDVGYAHLFLGKSLAYDQLNNVGGKAADHIVGTFKADADILGISYRYKF